MSNQFIEQLRQGFPCEIRYNPFGRPTTINIHTENSSTSISSGNEHFPSLIEFIESTGINPKPDIQWVAIVQDSEGQLLYYQTNLGNFVAATNYITDQITEALASKDIEIRETQLQPPVIELHANIFLPRHYTLNESPQKHIENFDFDSVSIGLPFPAQVRLIESIESDYFTDQEHLRKFLKNLNGNVIRIKFEGKSIGSVFNWSKGFLDHGELSLLTATIQENIALHRRSPSRGPTTNWYFDWLSLQHYIWAPILEATNKLIDLINRQAHRKATAFISRDELGDIVCLRAVKKDGTSFLWPLSGLRDEQIDLFPSQFNWAYHPIHRTFYRVRFLLDRGLYFEAIVVAQAALEGIVNGMFSPEIKQVFFDNKEPQWERKYKLLKRFIGGLNDDHFLKKSALNMYLSGGLHRIYELRNNYVHDIFEQKPEYDYSIGLLQETRNLLKPLTDTWESHLFLNEVDALFKLQRAFESFLRSNFSNT